jgi:hypothetical protein
MLSSSPSDLFRHRPQLLKSAFELWESGRYSAVVKAIFFSADESAEDMADGILAAIIAFRFQPDVIQCLGAFRNEQGRMGYNESFLNMLQRIDFHSLKYSRQEKSLNRKPVFSVKGSLLQVRIIEQMLKTWLYDVSVELEDN